MKTISRKELIVLSVALFAVHNVNTLFATSDGQFFIVQDRAKLHARSSKVNLTIYEIDRHEADALSAKMAAPKSKTKSKPKPEEVPTPPEAEEVEEVPTPPEAEEVEEVPTPPEAEEVEEVPAPAKKKKATKTKK